MDTWLLFATVLDFSIDKRHTMKQTDAQKDM